MKFRLVYKETDTYRATFTANSREEAQALIKQAVSEQGNLSDLPDFDSVGIDYVMTYEPWELEEV